MNTNTENDNCAADDSTETNGCNQQENIEAAKNRRLNSRGKEENKVEEQIINRN